MRANAEEASTAAAAAGFAPRPAPRLKTLPLGRKSCAQMRRDASAEAARSGPQGPAGDDAFDNERLVTALARDMLGEGREASQLAEEYGRNARALLDA